MQFSRSELDLQEEEALKRLLDEAEQKEDPKAAEDSDDAEEEAPRPAAPEVVAAKQRIVDEGVVEQRIRERNDKLNPLEREVSAFQKSFQGQEEQSKDYSAPQRLGGVYGPSDQTNNDTIYQRQEFVFEKKEERKNDALL